MPAVQLQSFLLTPNIWAYTVDAALIAVYYQVGPVAAEVLGDRPLLRRLSYCWIVPSAAATAARRIGWIREEDWLDTKGRPLRPSSK